MVFTHTVPALAKVTFPQFYVIFGAAAGGGGGEGYPFQSVLTAESTPTFTRVGAFTHVVHVSFGGVWSTPSAGLLPSQFFRRRRCTLPSSCMYLLLFLPQLTRRRTRGNLRDGARYCLLAGTLDGGLGAILPVDERVFRRLYALQGIMSNALGHNGAANPRCDAEMGRSFYVGLFHGGGGSGGRHVLFPR